MCLCSGRQQLQPRLLYPARLSIIIKGGKNDKNRLKKFMAECNVQKLLNLLRKAYSWGYWKERTRTAVKQMRSRKTPNTAEPMKW